MTDLGRVYKLTTIRAPEVFDVDTKGLGQNFFEELETVTEITEHQIEFDVTKNLISQPNTCDIVLYNLAEPARQAFTDGPVKIRLEAGYDNTLRLLFLGDLRYASNVHDGTEWKTKLQIADGARAYAHARVNKPYAKGTPITTIIGDLARSFGVPLPFQAKASPELSGRIAAGEVITGDTSDELTRILAPFGFEFSFQNGKLQIIPTGGVLPGEARLISEDDGMIGAPEMVPPKIIAPRRAGVRHRATTTAKRPRVPKLKVKHTLYPEIMPGEKIQVQSRSINGTFRVDVVKHKGNLFSDDWITEIEATDVAGSVQT